MKRLYQIVTNLSWGLLVFLLPITSLPLLAKAAGGTDVAPISVVFLLILVLIWLLPGILRGRGVPQQSIPLLIFFLIALIASFLAFFYPIPSFKNEPIWNNELPNIITLGIGVCFYLVTSLWISDEGKLKTFFRIVNISGAIALVYTLIAGIVCDRPAAGSRCLLSVSVVYIVERYLVCQSRQRDGIRTLLAGSPIEYVLHPHLAGINE